MGCGKQEKLWFARVSFFPPQKKRFQAHDQVTVLARIQLVLSFRVDEGQLDLKFFQFLSSLSLYHPSFSQNRATKIKCQFRHRFSPRMLVILWRTGALQVNGPRRGGEMQQMVEIPENPGEVSFNAQQMKIALFLGGYKPESFLPAAALREKTLGGGRGAQSLCQQLHPSPHGVCASHIWQSETAKHMKNAFHSQMAKKHLFFHITHSRGFEPTASREDPKSTQCPRRLGFMFEGLLQLKDE